MLSASLAKSSIVPSLDMLLNVGPLMNWVFSCINFGCHVHMTLGNGGRCPFIIDKWWRKEEQSGAKKSGVEWSEAERRGVEWSRSVQSRAERRREERI